MASGRPAPQHFQDILSPASSSPGSYSVHMDASRPPVRSNDRGIVTNPAHLHRRTRLPLRLGVDKPHGPGKLRRKRAIANLRACFIAHRVAVYSRRDIAELPSQRKVQTQSTPSQVSTALGRIIPLRAGVLGFPRPSGSGASHPLHGPLRSHRAGWTRPASDILRERREVRVLRTFPHPKHRRYVRRWYCMSVMPILKECSAEDVHVADQAHSRVFREQAGDIQLNSKERLAEADRKMLKTQQDQPTSTQQIAVSTGVDRLQELRREHGAIGPALASPGVPWGIGPLALQVMLVRQAKIIEHYGRIEPLARQRADKLAAENELLKTRLEESEAAGQSLRARAGVAEERAKRLERHLFEDRRV